MAVTSSSSALVIVVLLGVAAAAVAAPTTTSKGCREDALRVINEVYRGPRALPCRNDTTAAGSNKCPDVSQIELHHKFPHVIRKVSTYGPICATKINVSHHGHVELSCNNPTCGALRTTKCGITVACYRITKEAVTPPLPK